MLNKTSQTKVLCILWFHVYGILENTQNLDHWLPGAGGGERD